MTLKKLTFEQEAKLHKESRRGVERFGIYHDKELIGYVDLRHETKQIAKIGWSLDNHKYPGEVVPVAVEVIQYAWKKGYQTLITGTEGHDKAGQIDAFKLGFRVDYIDEQEDRFMYQIRLEKSWSNNKDIWKFQRDLT